LCVAVPNRGSAAILISKDVQRDAYDLDYSRCRP
jgi:hypothetical protein